MKTSALKPEIVSAWQEACTARSRAHAPYSKFRVGAALKIKNVDGFVHGCNVENASFGATICAERTAILSARAQHGSFEPEFLVLVTDTEPAVAPCALCLQVLSEFCSENFPIFIGNLQGVQEAVALKQLLPRPFEKSQLHTKPVL